MTDYSDKTAVDVKAPDVPTESLKDQIDGLAPDVAAIDWVYTHITGSSMVDDFIMPLTGDFNRIRANGDAWETIAKDIECVSDNLTANVEELQTHWTHGQAARNFETLYIKGAWFAGSYATAEVCRFVKKGFEVLADESIKLAQKAVDLLEKLLHKLEKLASRFIPGGGWAKAGADAVVDIFSGDVPVYHEIKEVWDLVHAILGLIDAIKTIVESATSFFNGLKEIGSAIKEIPEISSGNDAVAVSRDFMDGVHDVNDAKDGAMDAYGEAQQDLGDIKSAAKTGS